MGKLWHLFVNMHQEEFSCPFKGIHHLFLKKKSVAVVAWAYYNMAKWIWIVAWASTVDLIFVLVVGLLLKNKELCFTTVVRQGRGGFKEWMPQETKGHKLLSCIYFFFFSTCINKIHQACVVLAKFNSFILGWKKSWNSSMLLATNNSSKWH